MAVLTIRDLDDTLKQSLRIRAAHRNRSMEEEARQILRAALLDSPAAPPSDLALRIRARLVGLGDIVLPVAEREPVREPPGLAKRSPARGPAAKRGAKTTRR